MVHFPYNWDYSLETYYGAEDRQKGGVGTLKLTPKNKVENLLWLDNRS